MAQSAPSSPAGPSRAGSRTPVQLAAAGFGIVFLLVGILGFIPGVTTGFDQLALAGHMSGAALLGIFHVSVLHNVVHLLFGIAGLVLARTPGAARGFLVGGGVIYLVLFVYGLLIDQNSPLNFVPVNTADNYLHLALGVVMIAAGLLLPARARARTGSGPAADVRR